MSLFFWILPFPTVFHLHPFLDPKGSLHVPRVDQSGSDSISLVFVFDIPTYRPVSHLFLYFYSDFLSTVLNLSPLPVTPESKAHFHFTLSPIIFLVQILVKITGLFFFFFASKYQMQKSLIWIIYRGSCALGCNTNGAYAQQRHHSFP